MNWPLFYNLLALGGFAMFARNSFKLDRLRKRHIKMLKEQVKDCEELNNCLIEEIVRVHTKTPTSYEIANRESLN